MSDDERPSKHGGVDGGQWTWITATDNESRRRIKSHTSRAVKRRKGVRGKDAREQKLVRNRVVAPRHTESVTGSEVTQPDLIPSPASLLGAGRVDPFASYPIRLQSDEHLELIDHYMFQAPSLQSKLQKRVCFLPLFQEIRRVSFELANGDPAAFSTILAIASADISILRNEKDPMLAMIHNTRAIQLLSKRMSDLSNANLEGTIATVALQIIFQLLFEDCDSLEPHSDALEKLVKFGGGLDAIESSNPQLALLINLADYLPPTVALLGKRRFHLTDAEILNLAILSPVSLVAPKGLENLVYFDIYVDIKLIFLTVQRTTNAALSGDLGMYSGTEAKLKSQLHDLTVLGTSNASWSRRCEIMKCVYLSALIFIKVACRRDGNALTIEALILLLLTESETPWKGHLQLLIRELLCSNLGENIESLAPLMRLGASMNQQSWYTLRNNLHFLYGRVYSDPRQLLRPEQAEQGANSEAIEMSGLTALFGYFDMDDN